MYRQTEDKYKTIKMGNGTGNIYDYGCYLTSLCNGLNRFGYSFTPESLNDFFKNPNAWVGPTKNYIDVANINRYHPEIFVSFQQIDPWNDVPSLKDLLRPNRVVLGRVSGKAIGGTSDHFVLIVDNQNGVAVIHDPWTGKTEKITVRWSSLGNILGVRIFDIKPFTEPTPEPGGVTDETSLDLTPLGKEPDGTSYKIEPFGTVKAKIKAKDQQIIGLRAQNEIYSDSITALTLENNELTTANKNLSLDNGQLTDTVKVLQMQLDQCKNSHVTEPSRVPTWIRRAFGDNV